MTDSRDRCHLQQGLAVGRACHIHLQKLHTVPLRPASKFVSATKRIPTCETEGDMKCIGNFWNSTHLRHLRPILDGRIKEKVAFLLCSYISFTRIFVEGVHF